MSNLKQRYDTIDGLRMIAAIGIVLMHMKANNNYNISGFVYEKVIPSFTNFVYLFMVISAFGMCCGYYKKISNNEINLVDFYKKRYVKVLPFFAVLVFMDIIISPSIDSLYEAFADLSLAFGFFPNDISVIGVGWFLGLVFAFYIIFPFYCVLIKDKKSAWFFFIIALLLNYVGSVYFSLTRSNIIYSMCYFILGGIVFLYKEELHKLSDKFWWLTIILLTISVVVYYVWEANTITMLIVSALFLIVAIGKDNVILNNKITKFFGSISLEIYLSHMVIFRIAEKLHLNTFINNDVVQYMVTCTFVLIGTILFAVIVKKLIELLIRFFQKGVKNEGINDK